MPKKTTEDGLNNKFFMGVMDIEIKAGKIDNMKDYDKFRVYNNKFVKTPELALLIAFDEDNKRWKNDAEDVMKDVVYDPKTKEWKRTFLETTKGHTPTEKMIEKWKRGEYELFLITEYVQIMETILVEDENLVQKAVDKWNRKMNDLAS